MAFAMLYSIGRKSGDRFCVERCSTSKTGSIGRKSDFASDAVRREPNGSFRLLLRPAAIVESSAGRTGGGREQRLACADEPMLDRSGLMEDISTMFDAELRRLRHHNDSIAHMLDEVEEHLAQPLPCEPPFQVLSDMVQLQDRVYEMARMAGDLKRKVRDMVLQHTLAAEFTSTKR